MDVERPTYSTFSDRRGNHMSSYLLPLSSLIPSALRRTIFLLLAPFFCGLKPSGNVETARTKQKHLVMSASKPASSASQRGRVESNSSFTDFYTSPSIFFSH
ncbi:hypothetical protein BDW59DRAFT_104800 [Aspergillus cavernicola]|uniref:Uncharacterized protein n=1 Tax=Aspergillus cavernicola TaxID=176166 RepID=A0ABR4IZY4_9EURO